MRVCILASQENISFAESLLEDVHNVKIISRSLRDDAGIKMGVSIKKKIASADVTLVIIDEKFSENTLLNFELNIALKRVREDRNHVILPIVIDNAVVPTILQDRLYIKCDSKSNEDLYETKLKIKMLLEHRKYNTKKKNLTKHHSRTMPMIILTLAIELLAVLFVVLLIREPSFNTEYFDDEGVVTLSLGIITVVLSIFTLFTSYLSIMKRRWQEDEEEEIASYSRRLKRAMASEESKQKDPIKSGSKDPKKEIDALGRMMINLEDIKEFYTWSQKQAKASFILAVSMCISGFILMVVSILLPVVFRLSFQMSIIPAVGGIITELIAGTALVVYRNSLSQLNHYHKALHEDERFLSSVNLLGKFSTVEIQDEMLREIIRSEIQMNLAILQEDESMKIDKSVVKENLRRK